MKSNAGKHIIAKPSIFIMGVDETHDVESMAGKWISDSIDPLSERELACCDRAGHETKRRAVRCAKGVESEIQTAVQCAGADTVVL